MYYKQGGSLRLPPAAPVVYNIPSCSYTHCMRYLVSPYKSFLQDLARILHISGKMCLALTCPKKSVQDWHEDIKNLAFEWKSCSYYSFKTMMQDFLQESLGHLAEWHYLIVKICQAMWRPRTHECDICGDFYLPVVLNAHHQTILIELAQLCIQNRNWSTQSYT